MTFQKKNFLTIRYIDKAQSAQRRFLITSFENGKSNKKFI